MKLMTSAGIRFMTLLLVATLAGPSATLALDPGLLSAPWTAFATGAHPSIGPRSMVAGDLDGDGDIDLVIGLYFFGAPGVSVLLSRGEGTFESPAVYETGINNIVADIELADVDGDGALDILATIPDIFWFSNKLGVWINNGDGSFGPETIFATGLGPEGLTVADFTGDGFPDVVTTNYDWLGSGDTVSLLEHNGRSGPQAGFRPPVSYFCGDSPLTVKAADLDGDGDVDLFVGRESDDNAVLFNDGAGGFGAPTFFTQVTDANLVTDAIALVDVDLDGDVDLLASGMSNGLPAFGAVSVRNNDGAGSFGPPRSFHLHDGTFTPASLTIGDLNGDGYPDIVATTPSGRSMDGHNVLLNDRTGGFLPPAFYEDAKQPHDAVLVDVETDGDLDLITVANDSAVITVHDNPGDGVFRVLDRNFVGVLTGNLFVRGMDQGDLDNDGDLDVVTASGPAFILRNRGDGTFPLAETFDLPLFATDVKLRDMDGDGFVDLLVSSTSAFAVALNRGDGSFDPAVVTSVGAGQLGETDAYDIDADGFLDVVKVESGGASILHLARNSGNGIFFTLMPSLSTPGIPFGIEGADLNNDGHMDLVSDTASGLTVFPGNGDFSFGDFLATGLFSSGGRFVLSDLNADGNQDLVILEGDVSDSTSRVATMLGYGDGLFAFANRYLGPIGLESAFRISSDIDTGDLNGDGWLDVVVTSNAPDDVTVFIGNGDTTLREPDERYGAGYSASAASVGDYTGDGQHDIAVLTSPPIGLFGFGDAIVILPGRGRIDLAVEGSCPGPLTLSVTGAVPGSRVLFLGAPSTGSLVSPPGATCAGIQMSLGQGVRSLGSATADAEGRASLDFTAPPAACGRARLQALETTSCRSSRVGDL